MIHYAGKGGFNQSLGLSSQACDTTTSTGDYYGSYNRQRPNHFSIMSVKGSLIPEFSVSSAEGEVSPSRALVMLPSGEVLLGINEQEKVPNILIVQQCLVYVFYPINIFINCCPPEKKRFIV